MRSLKNVSCSHKRRGGDTLHHTQKPIKCSHKRHNSNIKEYVSGLDHADVVCVLVLLNLYEQHSTCKSDLEIVSVASLGEDFGVDELIVKVMIM